MDETDHLDSKTTADASGSSNADRPNEKELSHGRVSWQTLWTRFAMGPACSRILSELAYVRGVEASVSLRSELRGRLWSNHFGWQSLFDVGHAPLGSIGRR